MEVWNIRGRASDGNQIKINARCRFTRAREAGPLYFNSLVTATKTTQVRHHAIHQLRHRAPFGGGRFGLVGALLVGSWGGGGGGGASLPCSNI